MQHSKQMFPISGVGTIRLNLAKHVCTWLKGLRSRDLPQEAATRAGTQVFAAQLASTVAMEACGSNHHGGEKSQNWSIRSVSIAPAFVKPLVKRQKSDAADAEAI